jgi:ABC-type sugar transport system permease subunit
MYKKINMIGFLFILPFFLFFLTFNLYPIIQTLYLSFTSFDGYQDPQFIGIENYINLLKDPFFWKSFGNTWTIWLPNFLLQLSLAFLTAVLLTNIRYRVKFAGLFRAVFYFPNLVTAASMAVLFTVFLDWQTGALNQFLFGDDKSKYIYWLGKARNAQFVISSIQTWMWFGHNMILIMAAIIGIPQSYYEAAEIDGAGQMRVFTKITLPLIFPILTFLVVTSLIGGLQLFDIPFVMSTGPALQGKGDPQQAIITMQAFMYNSGFVYNRMGYAAAVSFVMFGIISIISVTYMKVSQYLMLGDDK